METQIMPQPTSLVTDEINEHKTALESYISSVENTKIAKSRVGVAQRFVRDCKVLISDMDTVATPTAADLSDFMDRKNSLEILCHDITQDMG